MRPAQQRTMGIQIVESKIVFIETSRRRTDGSWGKSRAAAESYHCHTIFSVSLFFITTNPLYNDTTIYISISPSFIVCCHIVILLWGSVFLVFCRNNIPDGWFEIDEFITACNIGRCRMVDNWIISSKRRKIEQTIVNKIRIHDNRHGTTNRRW